LDTAQHRKASITVVVHISTKGPASNNSLVEIFLGWLLGEDSLGFCWRIRPIYLVQEREGKVCCSVRFRFGREWLKAHQYLEGKESYEFKLLC
jgi:hypothetical protein